ncbi:MAG: sensor histidine kinase [Thermoleophilia bacterium]
MRAGTLRLLLASVRFRVVAASVALLALATIGSILVAREVVVRQIDDRIERVLNQEVDELQRLQQEQDPVSRQALGDDVRRLLEIQLARNVPAEGEAYVAYVDGKPFLHSRQSVPYRLDTDSELTKRWGSVTTVQRGRVATPGGDVEYLAVPVGAGGDSGVFVVGIFRSFETGDLGTITGSLAGVGVVVLLLGAFLMWRTAQRVIAPVNAVTQTAHQISETDLSRRIPGEGDDEVAELTRTFNDMLDRLESAFAAQRQFLDDAGHELRTPITIVRGHLELMGDDPAEREETMALVMDELDRMARIVDDVMVLARAERPDFLNYEAVDVATLTQEVGAKAQALARRRWSVERAGRGVIVADRQRLTQALVQLCQNAVQHTGEDDAIVLASTVAGGRARFTVRDTGPGVPVLERERVFERFARGSGERREGAGLGLTIVRAIAEAHGGRVELTQHPDGGAVFTIDIPVDPPAASPTGGGPA